MEGGVGGLAWRAGAAKWMGKWVELMQGGRRNGGGRGEGWEREKLESGAEG